VRLVVESAGPAPAHVPPAHVEQVVDNLLSNALEVTPAGGSIRVRTTALGGHAELHVVDDGPGLDEAGRLRAFDRFWRGDRSGEGSGLGLAISRRLMRAADGDVDLLPAPGGGIDARVRLPAHAPPAGAAT
jgi:signal transduction histidine kinase